MSWLNNLYCDKKIIERLTDLDRFKEFAIKNLGKVPDLRGYLFLVEITISSIINDTGYLIDGELYHMLHWGQPDQNRHEVMEILKNSNKEVAFIRELENLRGEIVKLRINKTFMDHSLKVIFSKLIEKIEEVNSFYFSKIKHTINQTGKSGENWHIVNNIYCMKNYVECDFDLEESSEREEMKPLFIPGSHYTIMSGETRKNYHLQNPKIEEEVYVNSYSLGLGWLYSQFNIEDRLIKNMVDSKKWIEMHHNGARINEFFDNQFYKQNGKKEHVPDIFDEDSSTEIKLPIQKDSLDNIGELRIALRDREVRTIEDIHGGDYVVTRSMFDVILYGLSFRADEENRCELIEFKTKYHDGEEIKYSYALFLPVYGSIWNASGWIFFDNLCVENSWEPTCYFKKKIHTIVEALKENIEFKSYFVKRENLEEYRKRHDIALMRHKKISEQIKTSEGLLVELLAFFYYLQKEKGKLEDFGWHSDPSNKRKTDIDAFFIKDTLGIIVQAKKSLDIFNPRMDSSIETLEKEDFDPIKELTLEKDLKEIYSHFEKAEKIILDKAKKENKVLISIEKRLFVFEKEEDEYIIPELRKELSKKGVNLDYFEDIEKNKSIFPEDLIHKVNTAFDRIVFDSKED